MNICYLTRSLRPALGGLDRYSYEVISRTAANPGISCIALVEQASGFSNERVVLKSVAKNKWLLFYNLIKIRKYLRTYEVIHALDLYPYGLLAALAGVGLQTRLFISGIGTDSVVRLDRPLIGAVLRWVYHRAEKVFCISKYTKKRILEKIPELSNLEVVYMGVDTKNFLRPQVAKSSTGQVIIGVGALKRRKGYHISIPAIAKIVRKYPKLKYYIVGSQSIAKYTQQLKDLVQKLGLENHVFFLEDLSDNELVDLYYKSDIFILTSINITQHFEGYGLVFLEAAACGLPTIGTYGCGIEEAVKDKETGLLVVQEDIDKTAAALDELLSDPVKRSRFGTEGRVFAQSLTWSRIVKRYYECYTGVNK